MNQKTTYEQIITEKLDALPLPDMADAIWARIEEQLDTDMPTDDGGNSGTPQPPSGNGFLIGGIGLFVFIAALITTFFINQNKPNQNSTTPSSTLAPTQTVIPQNKPPVDNTADKTSSVASPPQGAESNAAPVVNTTGDSALVQPGISASLPIVADSTQRLNDAPAQVTAVTPQAPPAKDTVQTKKKGRGVQGIGDDDYRITPTQKE